MKIMNNWDAIKKCKIFPELPDSFPDELLDENWCDAIHSQTLEGLNKRGGMVVIELLMNLKKISLREVIDKYGYNYNPVQLDVDELMSFLKTQNQLN